MKARTKLATLSSVLLLAACAAPATTRNGSEPAAGPRFAAGGPDAEDYGASLGYPRGERGTFLRVPFLVGSHSHLDELFEGRVIAKAATPSRLARAASEPAIPWEFKGEALTLDAYLARNPTTGLLIARGDTILVERYQYDRRDYHRFTSWSMAKTVTSMLIGIALAEGRIQSIDDLAAAYVPELAGTEYGRTSLRHLLQMSSGVRFLEEYSGNDDVMKLALATFVKRGEGGVPAATRYSYASAETEVLGLVLRSAVGRPITAYLQEKIWQPMGAEADATWLVDRASQEATFCCINAVLRDYARLGLLLAYEGNWRGRQLIPAAWIRDATTVRADQPHLRPGIAASFFGYGYQTSIFPGERRMFALLGVRGQSIFVDPQSRLVMVHTAVRKQEAAGPGPRESTALWAAAVRELGGPH
jgi:CubicO group peptidase (beta-lactamase class C family)